MKYSNVLALALFEYCLFCFVSHRLNCLTTKPAQVSGLHPRVSFRAVCSQSLSGPYTIQLSCQPSLSIELVVGDTQKSKSCDFTSTNTTTAKLVN